MFLIKWMLVKVIAQAGVCCLDQVHIKCHLWTVVQSIGGGGLLKDVLSRTVAIDSLCIHGHMIALSI